MCPFCWFSWMQYLFIPFALLFLLFLYKVCKIKWAEKPYEWCITKLKNLGKALKFWNKKKSSCGCDNHDHD